MQTSPICQLFKHNIRMLPIWLFFGTFPPFLTLSFFLELTKEELQAIFGERRCKPAPLVDCSNTTFGCCPDNFNAAAGPFDLDCPTFETCGDTRYGCCKDGATVAEGLRFDGCPPSNCDKTL